MTYDDTPSAARRLIWVHHLSFVEQLDAATWLETVRELRRLGWNVALVAPGERGPQSIRGVEVYCLPKAEVYLLGQMAFHVRVLRFLAREWSRSDLILFDDMSALWLLPLQPVRRLMRRPRPLLVMDTRSLPMSLVTWKDRLRAAYQKSMNRLAIHWADGQTAITEHMAQAVPIPSEKLWGIWPSGVDLGLFASAQQARKWPAAGEAIHLIYVGALHRERNLPALCRAIEEVNAEGMAFTLTLVGKGTDQVALERLMRLSEGRINLHPPVAHTEVPRLLARAHVGVLPFPDEEKFRVSSPIKLFEYMAAGLPILATKITCHTDVIGNGGYSFWAEDGSVEALVAALRSVWRQQASLSMMGREAASAAQAWTWQQSGRKLRDALEYGLMRSCV